LKKKRGEKSDKDKQKSLNQSLHGSFGREKGKVGSK